MISTHNGVLVSNWVVLDILFKFFDDTTITEFGSTCKEFKDYAVEHLQARALCMLDHFEHPWKWTFKFMEFTNPATGPTPFWAPSFKCNVCEDIHFLNLSKPNNDEELVRRPVLQQFPPSMTPEGFPTLMKLMRPAREI